MRGPVIDTWIESSTIGRRLQGQQLPSRLKKHDMGLGYQRGSRCGGNASRPTADDRDPWVGMQIAELLKCVHQRQRANLLRVEGDAPVEAADHEQVRSVANRRAVNDILRE